MWGIGSASFVLTNSITLDIGFLKTAFITPCGSFLIFPHYGSVLRIPDFSVYTHFENMIDAMPTHEENVIRVINENMTVCEYSLTSEKTSDVCIISNMNDEDYSPCAMGQDIIVLRRFDTMQDVDIFNYNGQKLFTITNENEFIKVSLHCDDLIGISWLDDECEQIYSSRNGNLMYSKNFCDTNIRSIFDVSPSGRYILGVEYTAPVNGIVVLEILICI